MITFHAPCTSVTLVHRRVIKSYKGAGVAVCLVSPQKRGSTQDTQHDFQRYVHALL